MITLTIISVIAIFSSPVIAVGVGQCLQDRKKKYDAKLNLLLILISHRENQVHSDFVMALNRIDLVYYNDKTVLAAWHKNFENFHKKNEVNFQQTLQLSFLDLVSEMSKSLGYIDLRQTDIDRAYFPEAHGNMAIFDQALKENLVGYLKSGKDVFEYIKNEADRKSQEGVIK